MTPVGEPFNDGALRGRLYRFVSIGDALPMHAHDEGSVHITFVMKGAIRASGDGWSSEHAPGAVVSFDVGMPHEIEAIAPDTVILNLLKTSNL